MSSRPEKPIFLSIPLLDWGILVFTADMEKNITCKTLWIYFDLIKVQFTHFVDRLITSLTWMRVWLSWDTSSTTTTLWDTSWPRTKMSTHVLSEVGWLHINTLGQGSKMAIKLGQKILGGAENSSSNTYHYQQTRIWIIAVANCIERLLESWYNWIVVVCVQLVFLDEDIWLHGYRISDMLKFEHEHTKIIQWEMTLIDVKKKSLFLFD